MKPGKLLCRISSVLAVGIVAAVSAMAEDLPQFSVLPGHPVTLTASQASEVYGIVNVDDDLTVDGAECTGLTNTMDVTIGASATNPVTVTVKNGARWIPREQKKFIFTKKGGTIVVSSPEPQLHTWGTRIDVPEIFATNIYSTVFGTLGHYSYAEVKADAEAPDGVMDIVRLLSNGTVSFRNMKNVNPNVAARILFEGGEHWVLNKGGVRFTVAKDAKIILESVDGYPIIINAKASSYKLFEGTGTLETRGDGDFMMYHDSSDLNRTITLSHDDGGEIVWNHRGRTVFSGRGVWKIGNDNILPYGTHNGPVVFYNDSSPQEPTTIDLNGKIVTVNGLLKDGDTTSRADKNSVTNSSDTLATLRLNVTSDANLTNVLTASFAPDAISDINGIKVQKIGAGALTLNSGRLPAVHSLEVAEGMFFATNITSYGGNLVAKDGTTMVIKHPRMKSKVEDGFCPDSFAVDANTGKVVLSNVWQRALTVRSGTASIENWSTNITPAEISWRPTASVIGAVGVEGGVLDVVRGRLVSTNMTIASGASLRIRGGAGITNRVEFYKTELSDMYYRFIFKESLNKQSFGLNYLYLRMQDGNRAFSKVSSTQNPTYTLNEGAASAADLNEGEYMYSCPNGIVYTNDTRSSGSCVYYPTGLSDRYSWGGVLINENRGLRLTDSNTWVTLTIRLRADTLLPLQGYQLSQDWLVDKLCAWEVQASADGTTWRTVDERRTSDIYTYNSPGNQWTKWEGYRYFNGEDGFQWRCLAEDNVFNCEGTVQVDEGGILDLSCVPEENISIKSLTVDVASGGGSIVKFRPAENGTLNIVGVDGELPRRFTVPVALPDAVDTSRFATWRVMINGKPSTPTILQLSDGVLKAVTPSGLMITFR